MTGTIHTYIVWTRSGNQISVRAFDAERALMQRRTDAYAAATRRGVRLPVREEPIRALHADGCACKRGPRLPVGALWGDEEP